MHHDLPITGAADAAVAAIDLARLRANIRTLIELDEAAAPVLSCYLNLGDHWNEAADRRAAEVRRALDLHERPDFDAALAPIRGFIGSSLRPDTRAVVAFARAGASPFFLGMQFQVPVADQLSLDVMPSIFGLVQLKDTYHRYVVLLVTEDYARILEVTLGALTVDLWAARPELRDRIGSAWTRERYQHHRRDRTDQFVQEKVRVLERLFARRGHSHLVIAGSAGLVARARAALPAHLAAKLVDSVEATAASPTSDVVDATVARFIAHEQQESLAAAALLIQELKRGGLAVAGTAAVLGALELGQVDLLIMATGYQPPLGWRCRTCGGVLLAAERPVTCRRCGELDPVLADVKEEMVRLAERHDTTIELVDDDAALAPLGGVGCLLRYEQDWRPVPA